MLDILVLLVYLDYLENNSRPMLCIKRLLLFPIAAMRRSTGL